MLDEVLNYIGLDVSKQNKKLACKKSEFSVAKSYDNSMLYKVYKMLPIKDIDILIGMSDRTTEIKERYVLAKPINDFIKENSEEFKNLLELAKIEDIKNIEKTQEEFRNKIPYFIKYDKNYLWQIYYSSEDNKYFMLFPAREEGETSALFYLIKKKLENSKEMIYVPICKEEPKDEFFSHQEMTDVENYIWLFTKQWPTIYEVEDKGKEKIYIVGQTKVKYGFESKYRIEISSKTQAEEEYTLLKALFILTTETSYKFSPVIDDKGNLRLEYNGNIIQINDLTKFISEQVNIEQNRGNELNIKIENCNSQLEQIKQEIKELNAIYLSQEKQIVMFLDCKKSVLKRIKYYFKKPIKSANFTISKKENTEKEETKFDDIIKSNLKTYTLSDLVKICKENSEVENKYKNIKADLNAIKNKRQNLERKINNAKKYLEEIEEHKKSLFEFWKFAKKDESPALVEGEEKAQDKIEVKFNLDEDIDNLAIRADILQRQKLSTDEINSIFACKYILNSINSVLTGQDEEKVLLKDLENLKKDFVANRKTEIFGEIEEDYTKIKNLKTKKHRENKKNIYSVLRINDTTTLEDYKNIVENIIRFLNEAYKKIKSITEFPVYYTSGKENEYTIAEIDPKKINLNYSKEKIIYKINITCEDNLLYFSNIIYYDNLNKTLPEGMDISQDVLVKLKKYENIKETYVNLLEEKNLFDVKITKTKVVEEV